MFPIPSNYSYKLVKYVLLAYGQAFVSVLHLDVNTRRINIDAGKEETTVEAILEELAQEIHSSVGVRMHRLGVVVWEVKLWMAAVGQANGAWRVIVNNVTGHTCTVHVSLFYFKISRKSFPHATTFLISFLKGFLLAKVSP